MSQGSYLIEEQALIYIYREEGIFELGVKLASLISSHFNFPQSRYTP